MTLIWAHSNYIHIWVTIFYDYFAIKYQKLFFHIQFQLTGSENSYFLTKYEWLIQEILYYMIRCSKFVT